MRKPGFVSIWPAQPALKALVPLGRSSSDPLMPQQFESLCHFGVGGLRDVLGRLHEGFGGCSRHDITGLIILS